VLAFAYRIIHYTEGIKLYRAETIRPDSYKYGKQHANYCVCPWASNRYLDVVEYDMATGRYPTSGFVFAGLMALMDPPRNGVKELITQCKTAGVRFFMVTGTCMFSDVAACVSVSLQAYMNLEPLLSAFC